jgi:hypothetical protein
MPSERAPDTHCIGGWVGPRAGLDAVVKGRIPSPRRESNPDEQVVQPVVSRYTDWAIPAHNDYLILSWHYISLSIVYGLNDRGSRVRFPAEAGNFSLYHRVQNGPGANPESLSNGYQGLFSLGLKRQGREADHSPLSIAEVTNVWNYTSTPPVRLNGVVLS